MRHSIWLTTLAFGCGGGVTLPAPAHLPEPFLSDNVSALVLTASISKPELALLDTATLTLTVANPTATPITLTFSSTCQVLPYIWNSQRMVYPSGGGWGCGAAMTSLTIPARSSHARKVVVHGGVPAESSPSVVALNPGVHHGYLELGDRFGRSAPASWTVLSR